MVKYSTCSNFITIRVMFPSVKGSDFKFIPCTKASYDLASKQWQVAVMNALLTAAAQGPNSRAVLAGAISSSRRGFSRCGLNQTEERSAVHLGSAPSPFRAALSEKTANHIGDCAEALMDLVANECSRRILPERLNLVRRDRANRLHRLVGSHHSLDDALGLGRVAFGNKDERRRAEELRQDRDRWHAQAERLALPSPNPSPAYKQHLMPPLIQ